MNIAFFSECYHPTLNGIVVSIDTFSQYLRRLGHRVHIHAPYYRGYHDDPPDVSRFPALRVPVVPQYPVPIPVGPRIAATFIHRRFDVVHTHSVFALSHVGASLAERTDVPLVSTFHTMLLDYLHYTFVPEQMTRPFVANLIRRYCNHCDLMIVPTAQVSDFLRKLGVVTEIQPLPTGIDVEFIRGGDRERVRKALGLPLDRKLLLYVGRLAREKNVTFLVDAVMHVLRERPGVDFAMVGEGPLKDDIREQVGASRLASRIHIVGGVSFEEVRDYYAAADIMTFASKTETQGLVVGEAMAAGLPVVAVRATGVSEFIASGEDGFLVDENPGAFVRTLSALLSSDSLRSSISTRARCKAQQFSAEASARRLEKFYQVLIASRKDFLQGSPGKRWGDHGSAAA